MPESDQPAIDLAALSRLEAAVGGRFLAYMLCCSVGAVDAMIAGTALPNEKQAEAIRQLAPVLQTVPDELDTERINHAIRHWLTTLQDDGKSIVRRVHEHIGGPEVVSDIEDELEKAIAVLAIDAYPAFLLPPDERLPREQTSVLATVHVFSHPEKEKFCDAALLDPILKQVFVKETEHSGRTGAVYTNTGTGGWVQLSVFPEMLLRNAWRSLDNDESPQEFVARAVDELRFARAVLSGESRNIPVRVAFAGILLPDDARIELSNGDLIRPVADSDRKLVSIPEDVGGKASHTDSSGSSTTINYDGDILLVHKFPYKVKIGDPEDDSMTAWFDDPGPHAALQRVVTHLRFSLMLSMKREHRVQIVESWRYFDQPLNQGWSMSYGDARRSTGIHPTKLTNAEVGAWRDWYERLNSPDVDRIELALTRVLRAASERREPSDVLIDSVIAWESLFGTRQGEPTFRVTASMAALLADSYEARKNLKKNLKGIYYLRSDVVHGNRNLSRNDYSKCFEALEFAIRAIRKLVEERTDILTLRNGDARSEALLLGATDSDFDAEA